MNIDQYVIKKDQNKFSKVIFENIIHEALKGGKGIRKPKWHYQPFIMTLVSAKSRFLYVPIDNQVLMIVGSQVMFGNISKPYNSSMSSLQWELESCP